MPNTNPTLEELWRSAKFDPNPSQRNAIEYTGGPLFLTAGPGSGKTRVLLWRTLNLIVYHNFKPEDILLSTFTEKAALQLEEGLRTLLANVTERTGKYYNLSDMYIGTLHALCDRLVHDRRFSARRLRPQAPLLIDELSQYLFLYKSQTWKNLVSSIEWKNANAEINEYFNGRPSQSRHHAVSNCITLFNRLSEECVNPRRLGRRVHDRRLRKLIDLYAEYQESLKREQPVLMDFALLQQAALDKLEEYDENSGDHASGQIFKHVIIDEYQDTNTIQERLIFKLSSGHKNICVVGDDDQALYRFRGATVENFIEFPERCESYLGTAPKVIPLTTNYRSRKKIVDFYSEFIGHPTCNWRRNGSRESYYRVPKDLDAHRKDIGISVIASCPDEPRAVCAEVASLVRRIIDSGKVEDPNQVAFLYPSLKSEQVQRMRDALEVQGLRVYAPRAGTFLEVEEAVAMMGLFLQVFRKPSREDRPGGDYNNYHDWIDDAYTQGHALMASDASLERYVQARRMEIEGLIRDYKALEDTAVREGWNLEDTYDASTMKGVLLAANGLSKRARKTFKSPFVESSPKDRFTLKYIFTRATSLDWNVLDLFYRLCGFRHFRKMFDLAESVWKDEGPVCNLSLVSQYLARFTDEYNALVLTANFLKDDKFQRTFFDSYLYALYRRGESEYEDAEDPFPHGRIPFLTIHQSKGLEFPIVVLGNPRKNNSRPQRTEEIVNPLIKRRSEPLDRMAEFDVMRMFYVALSRAKNLLVLAHYQGQGQYINEPFKSMLNNGFPRISQFDLSSLPKADPAQNDLPKTYSYTGDFLLYKKCPRQYMAFRKYGFVPSRSQTMFFGSLVHQTIDDLHQRLIELRGTNEEKTSA